jgi:hypothetical protein
MKRYNIIVIALAIVALAICVRDCRGPQGAHYEPFEVDTVYRVDTVILHDTIRIREPKPAAQKVVTHDTVWLPLVEEPTDTMHLANQFADHRSNGSPCDYLLSYVDSVPVVVPITERVYKDRTYTAVVSGYDPKLVSLDIYSEKSVVHHSTVVYKQPPIALTIGPYVGFGNKGFNYGIALNLGVPINRIFVRNK